VVDIAQDGLECGSSVTVRRGSSLRRPQRRTPAVSEPTGEIGFEMGPEDGVASGSRSGIGFDVGCADAVDWLRGLQTESVDLIVTDPPYESLEKHRAVGTTTRLKHSKASSNDWFQIFPNSRFPELFREAFRVLKRDRHFYLYCDQETMFVAKPLAEAQGFRFWKPIVWDKQKIGMGYHYRSRYEFVLFFEKGKRRLNDLGQPDVIECARIRGGYPTEKPTRVSEVLIHQSTALGELVVDPFMGSGSVGEAALKRGRSFLGNDLLPAAVAGAEGRLLKQGPRQSLYEPLRDPQRMLI
jgi:site-specific DNA-methyltransferase (adenine-specific)